MVVRPSALARLIAASAGAAVVAACSLTVDTSGLSNGAGPAGAPPDAGGNASEGGTSSGGEGGAKDSGSGASAPPPTGDAGPDATTNQCGIEFAQCSTTKPCCPGLHCGDARQCLKCLPKFDDCLSGTQCCSGVCDFICD